MSFTKLRLANFKGFSAPFEFELKPLTFFYGANSSGKSSVIHALAALSQTLKLTNNKRPIILDDERAVINLGRFIEVIHSKKYSDSIHIGFDLPSVPVLGFGKEGKLTTKTESVTCNLHFGCKNRTQEIFVTKAHFKHGSLDLSIQQKAGEYEFTLNPGELKGPVQFNRGFLVEGAYIYSLLISQKKDITESEMLNLFFSLNGGIENILTNTLYLGPFRQPPSRKYETYGSLPTEVGSRGESCMTLLANEAVQASKQSHIVQIGSWLTMMGLGKKVRLERIGKSDSFGVDITLPDDANLPIADLGFGVSQVLPVLAQCSFAPQGATVLFEQPELHLHPKAQAPLTEVFVETIQNKNCQILAETHSAELIRSAFKLLRSGKLKLEDIAIYKIERKNKASVATRLEIYQNGNDFDVSTDWERDFCA